MHYVNLQVKPEAVPIFSKARPIPVRLKSAVKCELDRLVLHGKITKVYSSKWSSPIVNVLKSDNSVRICGDFSSTINKYLDPVNTPLISLDDVISQIGNAKFFSKMDLPNALLQLPLNEQSKQYTTINTPEGLYQYNFLPYGLTASSGIFQSLMNKILNGIDNVICYQDDILILTSTISLHNKILDKVLNAMRKAGIKININKSKFLTNEVEYLGHIFNESGVHPDSKKLNSILNAPAPNDLRQVQAFIGLCNFYSRFIPNFTNTLNPLYALLKKNNKFCWGDLQNDAFNLIKQLFKNNSVLKLYNPKFETLLETDASGYGLGVVLMQRPSATHPWHTVQFASRSLNDAEKNYSNIEREALSVLYGCEKFRKYLLGCSFTVKNDHKPLEKILKPNSTSCSARLQRWSHRLSQFNFNFLYSKGKDNLVSDFLSRLPLPESSPVVEPYELIFNINTIEEKYISCNDIKIFTDADNDLKILKTYIKYGWPVRNDCKNIDIYKKYVSQMSTLKGCIIYNGRVLIPLKLRDKVIEILHEGHPGIVGMKSLVRGLVWYPGIDRDVENYVKNCEICQANRAKTPQNNNVEWPLPKRVWGRLHVDHFFYDNSIVFVVIDSLSKYIECEVVRSTSVEDTIDALRMIFSRNGLCDTLVSDNATSFSSDKFSEFLKDNGINHITPPPYSPATNGQAERGVRVVKDLLHK